MKLGALEAGRSRMVCTVGDEYGNVWDRASYPTLTPAETIAGLSDFFRTKGIQALGISAFGPLSLDPTREDYGDITTTPEPGWSHYPLLRTMRAALGVPVGIDTDVNGAALGEAIHGAGRGCTSMLYFTIGTGIGGGAIVDGKTVHGLVHPEMGHMLLRADPTDPAPRGFCPYHEGCLEGLANGASIERRWGRAAALLPKEHEAWTLEAGYLAQMCANAILMYSPQRIVLGGGIMRMTQLFPMIRERTRALLNGYVAHPMILTRMDEYIVAPALGDSAGAVGSLLIAAAALRAAGG